MLKKRNLGFTLIELLAVIVIVAIILLITIPVISGLLENARKGSFKVTAGMIVKAADIEYSKRIVKDQELTPVIYEYVDGEFIGEKDLDYRGERPKDGVISINEEGKVELSIHDGTFCAWKEINSDEIFIDKKTKEECGVGVELEPTDESCFVYEEQKTISFDINYDNCMLFFVMMDPEGGEEGLEMADIMCKGGEFYGVAFEDIINMSGIPIEEFVLPPFEAIENLVISDTEDLVITDYSDSCSRDVVIPNKINNTDVKVIGSTAFQDKNLTSVIIPNSVNFIKFGAFINNQLTSVVIPNSVTELGMFAFSNNQLTSLTIGTGITTIRHSAFGNNKLTKVTIPNNVIKIEDKAFDLNQLSKITIPNSVEYLNGFYGNQLTDIVIPDSVKTIGFEAFTGNALTQITFGANVETIEDNAFSYNELTQVVISDSVTTIGDNAFANNQLTAIEIPDGVTTIGNNAFCWNQLTSATISNTVTTIGISPFYYNPNLTQVTVSESNPNYKSINNGIYTKDGTKLITGTKGMSNNIAPTVTIIGEQAFHMMGVNSLTIPNSVKIIGDEAFKSNEIPSANIPNGLTTIGEQAFWSNKITSISIPSSVTMIGPSAFTHNSPLTEVTVSESNLNYKSKNNALYTKDGTKLMLGIKEMTNNIEPTVIVIDDNAFRMMGVTSVTIPSSVTTIGDSAFLYNDITELNISHGLTTIGSMAFMGNELTEIIIPGSVTTIEYYAFYYNQLTEILIPNSVTTIGYSAFQNNKILQDYAKIDNTVGNVLLGENVFSNNGPNGTQMITPTYLR